jgi:hypothetical protein
LPELGQRADRRGPSPAVAFVLIVTAAIVVAGGYLAWAASRGDSESSAGRRGDPPARLGEATAREPKLVFQHATRDEHYAHVAVAAGRAADAPRTITPLVCERVHYAGGRGLCLNGEQGLAGPRFKATIFDESFSPRGEVTLPGILTRARVSPDGRYGAATGFVTGHSYAESGEFSTTTVLIDLTTGERLGNLEKFTVTKDGRPIRAEDVNYWGVTFAGRDARFYATLQTGGKTYLVEGDVRRRSMRVLRENVECPSLSPDETRVAYKKRVDEGSVIWRLHVLDLETMTDTPLAESRMVDDQAEWLDDDEILYGLGGSTWAVRADGTGAPRRLQAGALSPAVVRN